MRIETVLAPCSATLKLETVILVLWGQVKETREKSVTKVRSATACAVRLSERLYRAL